MSPSTVSQSSNQQVQITSLLMYFGLFCSFLKLLFFCYSNDTINWMQELYKFQRNGVSIIQGQNINIFDDNDYFFVGQSNKDNSTRSSSPSGSSTVVPIVSTNFVADRLLPSEFKNSTKEIYSYAGVSTDVYGIGPPHKRTFGAFNENSIFRTFPSKKEAGQYSVGY